MGSPKSLPLSTLEIKSCWGSATITECIFVLGVIFSFRLPLSCVGFQVVKLIELSGEDFTVGGIG